MSLQRHKTVNGSEENRLYRMSVTEGDLYPITNKNNSQIILFKIPINRTNNYAKEVSL